MNAYDYEKQRWVSDDEAKKIALQQLEKELAIVESERGPAFLAFVHKTHNSCTEVARTIRAKIAEINAGTKGTI